MTIIYIHGFGGSGLGVKASLFREYYHKKGIDFLAPSLSYVPSLAISTLEEMIELLKDVYLIGSSLGGYMAIYLSHKYQIKSTLINPAVDAPNTLQKYLGCGLNFYDNSHFEWNQKHIKMVDKYKVESINPKYFLTLLQTGDEILDYKEAQNMLQGSDMIIEEGGNHSFEGIERHFKRVDEFLV